MNYVYLATLAIGFVVAVLAYLAPHYVLLLIRAMALKYLTSKFNNNLRKTDSFLSSLPFKDLYRIKQEQFYLTWEEKVHPLYYQNALLLEPLLRPIPSFIFNKPFTNKVKCLYHEYVDSYTYIYRKYVTPNPRLVFGLGLPEAAEA